MRRFLGMGDAYAVGAQRLTEFLAEPSDWALWRDAPIEGRSAVFNLRSPSGRTQLFRGDLRATGDNATRRVLGVFVEGDDQQHLRAAAQHSARMEALGCLTAGIAHDFNNLLTVLVGNLYLLAEELRDQPKVFGKLKAARDAGKRGTELIKQLLAFARREEVDVGIIDPAKVIDNLIPLVRRALGVRITLDTAFNAEAGTVRASTAQLESVIVNLAVNARDAIDGKGRITIEVSRVQVAPVDAAQRHLARGGPYVAIRVKDSGNGIKPELIDRVFEPFFSTKGERGGTGLGLSMVRWFAEQAGGSVEIQSVVGQGTAVSLLLPQQTEYVSDAGDKTMPLSILPTGTERVVVLAPDEAVRATIHQTLEVLGYRVTLASGVEDLLASVAAEDTHLLVLDGLGRSDSDVLIRARALRPGLPIIVTVDAGRPAERFPTMGVGTLTKPFTLADLAGTVRRTLDAVAGGA
jgi:signal transduction histidine kinase/CheY-like chemotaxis protein